MSDKPHETIDITRIVEVGPNDVFVFRLASVHTQSWFADMRERWEAKFPRPGPTMILLEPGIELEGVYRKVE